MKYTVKQIVVDYGIFYNDRLIVIMNSYYKAKQVCRLLNIDLGFDDEEL